MNGKRAIKKMELHRLHHPPKPAWVREVRVNWTNWTFGAWWGRVTRTGPYHVGIDLGPLEVVWTRKREKR